MALPFVDFILSDGRLITGADYTEPHFPTVLGVRNGRLYLLRFYLLLLGIFKKIPANTRIFLVPSDTIKGNTSFGDWCETVAVWFQKSRISSMRAGLGIGRDSYLSVWDNDVELQFYFYPVLDEVSIPQAIDIGPEPHTIGNTMSNIQPISDRVFLEAIEDDRMTKSGIVLPDSAEKERPVKGRILAVGAGKRNDHGELNPMSVKVGDVVLFKKYGPDEIELEGKKYLVAEESDILAVLEA